LRTWAQDHAALEPDTLGGRHEALWEARAAAEEARLRWALSDRSDRRVSSECIDAFSALRTHAHRDGFPWEEAYAGLRLAEAMVRRQTPHDEVAAVLREAHARAVGLGADHLAVQLATLARATRTSLLAVPAEVGAPVPVDPLTPREREVLAHLVAGRTNAEIAEALFLSVKTVGIHVSNVLRKTGTHSRGEAALWATRTGRAAADEI
jgi:DNA-binding CsgD family transcriptional regulator